MRASIIFLLLSINVFAHNPLPLPDNQYGKNLPVAASKKTLHIQGREYVRGGDHDTGVGEVYRRRVLIYDKRGNFIGYSKLGRELGDSQHRHKVKLAK